MRQRSRPPIARAFAGDGTKRGRLSPVTTLLALSALLSPSAAGAQARLPLEVTVVEMVNLPRDQPSLTLRAVDAVSSLRVVVRDADRVVLSKRLGRMRRNASRVLRWRAAPGVYEYTIELSGRGPDGQATVSVPAAVQVMRPIQIEVRRDQVDLTTRTIPFTLNNPAGRVRLQIFSRGNRSLHEGETDLSGRPAGATLSATWPALPEPIGRIVMRVHDVSDSWTEHELVPFFVDIPHEEVEFESGRWEIRPSERPKLDEAHEQILAAIAEHGADLSARLYILGHTDTVGSHPDNQRLSERRARAIARYLLERGRITIPIMSRGFGETQLRVETADDVDEPRNRRAQYILAAEAPSAGRWTRVQ